MEREVLKLSDEITTELLWEGASWEEHEQEEIEVYKVVSKLHTYGDLEKAYSRWDYVIKRNEDSKFFKANLIKSYNQGNEDVRWVEVFPEETKTIIYK